MTIADKILNTQYLLHCGNATLREMECFARDLISEANEVDQMDDNLPEKERYKTYIRDLWLDLFILWKELDKE